MGVRAHEPYTALVIPVFRGGLSPERALSRGSAPAHGFLQPFLDLDPACSSGQPQGLSPSLGVPGSYSGCGTRMEPCSQLLALSPVLPQTGYLASGKFLCVHKCGGVYPRVGGDPRVGACSSAPQLPLL